MRNTFLMLWITFVAVCCSRKEPLAQCGFERLSNYLQDQFVTFDSVRVVEYKYLTEHSPDSVTSFMAPADYFHFYPVSVVFVGDTFWSRYTYGWDAVYYNGGRQQKFVTSQKMQLIVVGNLQTGNIYNLYSEWSRDSVCHLDIAILNLHIDDFPDAIKETLGNRYGFLNREDFLSRCDSLPPIQANSFQLNTYSCEEYTDKIFRSFGPEVSGYLYE